MEDVISILGKLISHEKSARSIGSVEEAEAFAAKVQELMFRHKLSMTDVEFAQSENDEPVLTEDLDMEELTGRDFTTRQTWISILLSAVARANFCRAIIFGGGYSMIFGRATDCAAAKALFRYLYEAVLEAAPRFTREHCTPEQLAIEYKAWGYTPATARRLFSQKFKLGFAYAIQTRLAAQQAELKAGAGEKGLIRIDRLEKAVADEVDRMFPWDRRKGRTSYFNSGTGSGFAAGEAYGSSIGISSTKRLKGDVG